MKIKKAQLIDMLFLLAFKVALDISYVKYIHSLYSYQGYVLDINTVKMIESYLIILALFLSLPRGDNRLSKIAIKILFLLMIVPTVSFYGLANKDRLYTYFLVGSFLLTIVIVRTFPSIRIRKVKGSTLILVFFLGCISLLVYAILIKMNGIPTFRALDFSSVYEIRRTVNYGPKIMGYLVKWVGNVINCFLIGLAWYKRKYLIVAGILTLQLVLYLICAHKSFLLAPFIVLFLLYTVKRKRLMRLSLTFFLAVIVVACIFHQTGVSDRPISMFVRRTFFDAACVSYHYYDFFSKNPKMYLSESKTGLGIVDNPYKSSLLSSANIIGMVYMGNPRSHMNTGYLGNAYMNLGFIGMVIFSVILGFVFVLADSVSKKTNILAVVSAMAIPIIKLTNGALLSVGLTGGLLFSLGLVWLYREEDRRMFDIFNIKCDKYAWNKGKYI